MNFATHKNAYARVHAIMCVPPTFVHTCMHAHTHTHVHIQAHLHTEQAHKHTHAHTYIHTTRTPHTLWADGGVMVTISAFHHGDRGSNPSQGSEI